LSNVHSIGLCEIRGIPAMGGNTASQRLVSPISAISVL
jgi:hypothetical protein